MRIDRVTLGNLGDVKTFSDGVGEMRVDYGPGYRIYFAQHGKNFVVLFCGGDKKSQRSDFLTSKKMAKEWFDGA